MPLRRSSRIAAKHIATITGSSDTTNKTDLDIVKELIEAANNPNGSVRSVAVLTLLTFLLTNQVVWKEHRQFQTLVVNKAWEFMTTVKDNPTIPIHVAERIIDTSKELITTIAEYAAMLYHATPPRKL